MGYLDTGVLQYVVVQAFPGEALTVAYLFVKFKNK